MALPIDWQDNVGMVVNAAYLNLLDTMVNAAYPFPVGGMPKTDMAAGVQTSLGKADTATQPADVAAAQLIAINTQVDNYTLVAGDANRAVHINKATAVNVTIAAGVHAIGDSGEIVQHGAGQVTVLASGTTINKASSLKTRTQWSSVFWRCYAANTFLLTGDAE